MKAKTYSALQKTYDQSYLTYSYAVHYEFAGNQTEALRCWRECLTQLQGYNALICNQRPTTETEKALLRSLKDMKERCEDRAGLLQAILVSRVEAENSGAGSTVAAGGGVPLSPPAMPDRPVAAGAGMGTLNPPSSGQSRSPSPDKRSTVFLSTLRQTTPRRGSRRQSEFPDALRGGPMAAAQAATMAWTSKNEGSPITQSLSTGDLPIRERGSRRGSTAGHDRDEDGSGSHGPTVRRRPGINTLKTRPRSSIASTSPTASSSSPDDEAPPPPPPHRVPVQRLGVPINRKPVPQRGRTPPDPEGPQVPSLITPRLPPKPPVKPPQLKNIDTNNGYSHGRHRSASESAPRSRTVPLETPPASPYSPRSGNDTPRETSASRSLYDEPSPSSPSDPPTASPQSEGEEKDEHQARIDAALAALPKNIDPTAARQVANEIVVRGDEVRWDDVAGLTTAKSALKEAVVYPFLRPDLFMGLREPARGLLLFGPPGTGKTMLARAVATESKSTFFSISASSLTSKYLGESEKLVRALFAMAKQLAPSIIFVDEIDSLLSARTGHGEHEATTRLKTEFLIQWSDLARAAAGKETANGDASRVLVLAATNLPWAIDDAARRRFVRRQYIPLPEPETRRHQLLNLIRNQKHRLEQAEFEELVSLTEGFSGSDITALAKDAAMGPLRSLGEELLRVGKEEIREIIMPDFRKSLESIRPSVGKEQLGRFEEWAERFGERGV